MSTESAIFRNLLRSARDDLDSSEELRARWDMVLQCLLADKELAKVPYENGSFPLHEACYLKAPRELIELLIRIHPDASKERDSRGRLALHLLFMENDGVHQYEKYDDVSEDTVDALIAANPDAVAAKTDDNEIPLHFAARNNFAPGKAVLRLLAAYPEAASIADHDRDYPLHLACMYFDAEYEHADFHEIVEALLKAYPDAASLENLDGNLPLHCCIEDFWRSMDDKISKVFKIIFDANGGAAKTKGYSGRLPLHKICLSTPSEPLTNWHMEMLDSLMEASPKAACAPDDDGCLPLHHACREWPIGCKDLLAKLMAANPRAIHTPDNEVLTPLDYAMKRENDSAEFVRELFTVSSGGVMLAQMEGMTVAFAGSMARIEELEEELKDAKKHNPVAGSE